MPIVIVSIVICRYPIYLPEPPSSETHCIKFESMARGRTNLMPHAASLIACPRLPPPVPRRPRNSIRPSLPIEVSILRFMIRILRFDTIQMDKDTNLYFVSLERRILSIVSISFCIPIRYVS
jgi:hypothetical protein